MTTPTTSRVSDAMVEAACDAYENYRLNTPDGKAMRAAIEAALASQGGVVAVSEIQALQAYYVCWNYQELDPCEQHIPAAGTVVVLWSDLYAILNRGGK